MRTLGVVVVTVVIACCLAVLVLYPAPSIVTQKISKITTVYVHFTDSIRHPVDLEQLQTQIQPIAPVVIATKAALQWWQSVFASAGRKLIVAQAPRLDDKWTKHVQVGSGIYELRPSRPCVRVCPRTLSVCFDHSHAVGLSTARLSVIAAHAFGHVFQLPHEGVSTSLMQANVDWEALPAPQSPAEALAVRGLYLRGVEGVCRCCEKT